MKRLCLFSLVLLLVLSGCSKSGSTSNGKDKLKSCTYTAPSGDIIEISVPVNKGYDITSGSPFEITKDGVKVFDGKLGSVSDFTGIYKSVRATLDQQLIVVGSIGDVYYYGYTYSSGCNFVGYIHTSSILLQSSGGGDTTKEAFEELRFKLVTGAGELSKVPELDLGTGAAVICTPFSDGSEDSLAIRGNYGFAN